jgi:pseudaminic acid cytidylyltransferase
MHIAIIPARSNSKRIKKKNIKLFDKKPIIYYPIKEALKSRLFDKVYVTTNDIKIAKIAIKMGAEIPFIRENKFSGDKVTTIEVIQDAIKKIEIKNEISSVCCIYPTSCFVKARDLINSFKLYKKNSKSFIISATNYNHPPQRAFYFKNKFLTKFTKVSSKKNTQNYELLYHDAGQFYWGSKKKWIKSDNFFEKNTKAYIFDSSKVQDIDTISDWKTAELKFKNLNEKK